MHVYFLLKGLHKKISQLLGFCTKSKSTEWRSSCQSTCSPRSSRHFITSTKSKHTFYSGQPHKCFFFPVSHQLCSFGLHLHSVVISADMFLIFVFYSCNDMLWWDIMTECKFKKEWKTGYWKDLCLYESINRKCIYIFISDYSMKSLINQKFALWSQLDQYDDLILFSVLFHHKLNIFGHFCQTQKEQELDIIKNYKPTK